MARPQPARKRLPAADRRAALIERAAEAFAEQGFTLSTREIAARCGVTQALLYRYFDSKAHLVEAVLDRRFLSGREPPDPAVLLGDAPLENRIGDFYADFVSRGTAINLRLFLRAALDGLDLPLRYGARLDDRMLRPVLDALCRAAGLPPPVSGALDPDARELAMMLHGCAVFSLIRQGIYGRTLHLDPSELVRVHVRVWLPGALAELRQLSAKRD